MVEETLQALADRIDALVAAIPGADPGGRDVSEDDEYLEIDALADALLRAGNKPRAEDADALIQRTESLLAQRSKNLPLVGYWIYAIFTTQRYRGLCAGLRVLRGLLDQRWSNLWPRRTLFRQRTIEFLNDLAKRIALVKPTSEEADALALCGKEMELLRPLIVSRFGGNPGTAPSLAQLQEVLRQHQESLGLRPPEAEAHPEGADGPASPAAPAPTGSPADNTAWMEGLLAPITNEYPAGREDPRLSEEVDHPFARAESLFGSTEKKWPAIIEACETCLREQAKDVVILAFLAVASCRQSGLAGLLRGLQLIQATLARFGAACYPRSAVGRTNAFLTLSDRISEVRAAKPTPADAPVLRQILSVVRSLPQTAAGAFGAAFAALPVGKMTERIEGFLSELSPAEAQAPAANASGGAPPASPAEAPTAIPATPALSLPTPAAPGAPISADQVEGALVEFVGVLRRAQPASPTPYRLLRVALWSAATEPPQVRSGRYGLSVDRRQTDQLEARLRADKPDWSALVDFCESALAERGPSRWWLDLNRVCHQALRGLGQEYQAAARAVVEETGLLLRRLPELTSLAFQDGRPFADPATQQWLSREVAASLGTQVAKGGGEAAAGTDELLDPVVQAFAKDDLAQALDQFYAWFAQLGAGPLRVRAGLLAVRKLEDRQQWQLARALLASLSQELRDHHAHLWAPALCLDVWSQLHNSNKRLQGLLREKNDVAGAAALEDSDYDLSTRLAGLGWKPLGLLRKS